jgi:transposase
MEILYPRCAGLYVHKDSVVARIRCVSEPVHDEVKTFATTTSALLELNEFLSGQGVTHVAMEATRVYWKLVRHLPEGDFELILADAQHIRNVRGRKTDVIDAGWIADLLAHGLIRSSFVPPAPIQELRDLTRIRKQLVREVSQHSSRIQKVLEDANLKLGSVLSNVLGKSGRAILQAPIDQLKRADQFQMHFQQPARWWGRMRPCRASTSSARFARREVGEFPRIALSSAAPVRRSLKVSVVPWLRQTAEDFRLC